MRDDRPKTHARCAGTTIPTSGSRTCTARTRRRGSTRRPLVRSPASPTTATRPTATRCAPCWTGRTTCRSRSGAGAWSTISGATPPSRAASGGAPRSTRSAARRRTGTCCSTWTRSPPRRARTGSGTAPTRCRRATCAPCSTCRAAAATPPCCASSTSTPAASSLTGSICPKPRGARPGSTRTRSCSPRRWAARRAPATPARCGSGAAARTGPPPPRCSRPTPPT